MNRILEMKYGSHLYGTNTPNSDLDFKGIYLPSAREIILHSYKEVVSKKRPKAHGERNTKDDIDLEYLSFDRFMNLLCDGQTMALDMLFGFNEADCINVGKEIMPNLFAKRSEFLNKNVNAFVGYARQQAAKYGVKGSRMDALKATLAVLNELPDGDRLLNYEGALSALVQSTAGLISLEKSPLVEIVMINGPRGFPEPHLHVAGRKVSFHATVKYAKSIYGKVFDGYGARAYKASLSGGRDYKALSHAIRVNGEARELLETGRITFPRPDAAFLLEVKTEQVPFEQIAEVIEEGLASLIEAQDRSNLRAEPNRELAADIVFDIYNRVVKGDI